MYLATKVKARNFLNNISYRRVKKQDFVNFSFIVDIFIYLIKDFNPFFLHGKFNKDSDWEMVKMLWEYLTSKSLYEFIKLPESFVKFCDGKNYFKEANLIIKRHAYNKVFYNE